MCRFSFGEHDPVIKMYLIIAELLFLDWLIRQFYIWYSDDDDDDDDDDGDDDDDDDNEFISAYPFYVKLALRPKIIYTKKKYCTMRYREIIS